MFYEQNAHKADTKEKSPARVAAGSRNGKLAAGTKTPAGLSASAQNAHKHGYYSRVFTVIGTEDKNLYDQIRDSLRDEYAPATVREHQLVEELAQHNWLLNRNFNIENAYMNSCIAAVILEDDAPSDAPINVISSTVEGYKKAASEEKMITMLYRQRNQIQRDLIRATKTLESLIALRRKDGRPTLVVRPTYQEANTFTSRAEALAALGIETDPAPTQPESLPDSTEATPESAPAPASKPFKTNPLAENSRNEGNGSASQVRYSPPSLTSPLPSRPVPNPLKATEDPNEDANKDPNDE